MRSDAPSSALAGRPARHQSYEPGPPAPGTGGLRQLFFWLLTGDLVFTFMDKIEPNVLPLILKQHGARDTDIALIISSTAAIMQFFVTPIFGYRSDRLRTPRGRRIPYLLWAAPFASALLALTPFAPEIAAYLFPRGAYPSWLAAVPMKPVILMFALISLGYRFFHAVISAMFFALFRDVVPESHMGRFLALFRMFGAIGTFGVTYWLVGLAETHAKEIFIGVAVLNLVGFWTVCHFVREGELPPVADAPSPAGAAGGWRAVVTFVRESYRQPIYWWTYGARLLIYAAVPTSAFIVFFAQRELQLPVERVGHMLSWSSLLWLPAAYPVGRAIDRWGAVPVMGVALTAITGAYLVSFVAVTGATTFLASSITTGVLFWIVMLGQIALAQEIFRRERYAQLSAANVLVQSLAVALVIGPAAGILLDSVANVHLTLHVPAVGAVTIERYRFVNLVLAALYGLATLCTFNVYRHWKRLGGAAGRYTAPL